MNYSDMSDEQLSTLMDDPREVVKMGIEKISGAALMPLLVSITGKKLQPIRETDPEFYYVHKNKLREFLKSLDEIKNKTVEALDELEVSEKGPVVG